jgi:hypothetical protein
MAFVDEYSKVLSPFLKKYKDAENEKQRKAVLKNAADAVTESKDLFEGKGVALPKDLQAVLSFFLSFFFSFLNIFLYFSPSLVISKDPSKRDPPMRKPLSMVGSRNLTKTNKCTTSGTSLNKIIQLLLRRKFSKNLQTRIISASTKQQ